MTLRWFVTCSGSILVLSGLVFIGLGIVLYLVPSVPLLGKLPGDLRIERPGIRFYFPITTCILLSVAISLCLWALSKLR